MVSANILVGGKEFVATHTLPRGRNGEEGGCLDAAAISPVFSVLAFAGDSQTLRTVSYMCVKEARKSLKHRFVCEMHAQELWDMVQQPTVRLSPHAQFHGSVLNSHTSLPQASDSWFVL